MTIRTIGGAELPSMGNLCHSSKQATAESNTGNLSKSPWHCANESNCLKLCVVAGY